MQRAEMASACALLGSRRRSLSVACRWLLGANLLPVLGNRLDCLAALAPCCPKDSPGEERSQANQSPTYSGGFKHAIDLKRFCLVLALIKRSDADLILQAHV